MSKKKVSKEVYSLMQGKLTQKLAEKLILDAEVLMLQIALENCESEKPEEIDRDAFDRFLDEAAHRNRVAEKPRRRFRG